MKPRHILIALIAFAVCLFVFYGCRQPERHRVVYAEMHTQRVPIGTLYTNEFVCGEGWTMDSVVLNDCIQKTHGKTLPFVIDTPGLPSETIHVPALNFKFSDMGKATRFYKGELFTCAIGNHAQNGWRTFAFEADANVGMNVVMYACGRVSAKVIWVSFATRDTLIDYQNCKVADE